LRFFFGESEAVKSEMSDEWVLGLFYGPIGKLGKRENVPHSFLIFFHKLTPLGPETPPEVHPPCRLPYLKH
jgi:hypothetical protein